MHHACNCSIQKVRVSFITTIINFHVYTGQDLCNISSTQEPKEMQNDCCDSCKTQDTTTNIITCITPSTITVTTVPVLPTTTLADQYTPTVMPSTPSPPNNSSVTSTLIAITAILFISLVVVVTGWAVTCFVAIKKGRITYKISQGRSVNLY